MGEGKNVEMSSEMAKGQNVPLPDHLDQRHPVRVAESFVRSWYTLFGLKG
jgi:hypothetical protein